MIQGDFDLQLHHLRFSFSSTEGDYGLNLVVLWLNLHELLESYTE